jgi:predicted site-specific integrase-resolvase
MRPDMSDDNSRPNVRIPRRKAAERNGVSVRTLIRWEKDPKLNLPKPFVVNGRVYFDDGELREWEISRNRKAA